MASPGLESFCCIFTNGTFVSYGPPDKPTRVAMVHHDLKVYSIISIISASISIAGALYQLLPRKETPSMRHQVEMTSFIRQNNIICWLALADFMAALGILIRSALWLYGYLPFDKVQESGTIDFPHLFCALSSAWIQYFYISTYSWTFCYALDVYLLANEKPGLPCLYHLLSWGLSLVLCMGGLLPLYFPSLLNCATDPLKTVPHFLSTYIPVLLVMIINPVFYIKTSRAVQDRLRSSGHYTDTERRIVAGIKNKFFLITIVFFFCWSPNVLNGLLLLVRINRDVSHGIFVGVWIYMAIVNPSQAFLNSLVYRGYMGWQLQIPSCCKRRHTPQEVVSKRQVQSSLVEDSSEFSPLLAFRR